MYEHYYGLRERPFDLSPNPRFLFLSPRHREALTHLRYGLTGRPGITLLVGEAGTGKTTLVRAALQQPGGSATIVSLSNPTLTRAEFYDYIAAGFGFSSEAGASKTQFLRELEAALMARQEGDGVLALIVDEAQSLPHDLLEEIRLLTNLEAPNGRSLTVALAGQPELAQRLNEPALRQLKQRVALRAELRPFNLKETAAYMAARLAIAGGSADGVFTRDAVILIQERSKGIPRTISVICDNALVTGFAAGVRPVGRDIVLEVCGDLELPGEAGAPVAPPPEPVGAAAPRSLLARSSGLAKERSERATGADSRPPLFAGFTRRRRFSFFS